MTLLNNRWPYRIDYGHDSQATRETIWVKMYAYRSALAHGGKADFRGDLQILKSHEDALKLLKQTTKAVIRYALQEPQLLKDLRDC